jgi:hypothetical protein
MIRSLLQQERRTIGNAIGSLFLLLAMFGVSGRAGTVISVTGSISAGDGLGLGSPTEQQISAAEFSTPVPIVNGTILVTLSGYGYPVTAWLTNKVGAGTTSSNVIATQNFLPNTQSEAVQYAALTGVNAAAGTYYLVLESAGQSNVIGWDFTTAPSFTGSGTYIGSLGAQGTEPFAFGPSANFGGTIGTFLLEVLNEAPARPLSFIPVRPCRIADTRYANGAFGSPSLVGGASRSFTIPSSSCGIPTIAEAYALNVTVVPHGQLDYLTVWPTGVAQPVVSTLNSVDGRIKANAAIIPAGTAGAVSVYATNATDVILDINGYFVASGDPNSLTFHPMTPCRLADTRYSSYGSLGPPSLSAGGTRTFALLSGKCDVPSSAKAYSLNFTAVPPGPLDYITTFPTGETMPLASTLNDVTGTIVANAAIVPAGTDGSVDVFAYNATDLVIDINGYFAAPAAGGLALYNLTPCRVLDTRNNGAPPFSGELDVFVTGNACGASPAAEAYVFNATVVPPAALDYLTLWPRGGSEPLVSTLNAVDGAITSNMAIVPTTNGSIASWPSNPTQLILDIFGYFAP